MPATAPAATSTARSAAERLKCFVLVEVLEFIPFRDFNADARAPRWTTTRDFARYNLN